MKATYDARTDTLTIFLKPDAPVSSSDDDKPGVILDSDAAGNLVPLGILDASQRVGDTSGSNSTRWNDYVRRVVLRGRTEWCAY